MLLRELFENEIDEVNMSPGALTTFSKTQLGQSLSAGFEAELIVPDSIGPKKEYDPYDDDIDYDISKKNIKRKSIYDVAGEIQNSIGMTVKASEKYHGVTRGPNFFILEPDSSIQAEKDEGEAGFELVSPPMPILQTLDYLDKVFSWAKATHCRTDESTGFHMSVSIPNQTRENVDHFKFILFLGDDYILKQFQRDTNDFCTGMYEKVMKYNVKNLGVGVNGSDIQSIANTFKGGMNTMAANAMKRMLTYSPERKVSVNIKDNYIEVRSAGGDYLNQQDDIKVTLLRYIRALAVAADPEAEKNDYAKKMYKFFSSMMEGNTDVIKFFVDYNAGKGMPVTALKGAVRQAQYKRGSKDKDDNTIGEGSKLYKIMFYDIKDPSEDPPMFSRYVRGNDRADAMNNFKKVYNPSRYMIDRTAEMQSN